jgi:hypothetical protein
MEALFKNP